MSGGVDSSVAAALMLRDGHEVVGATMRLWGGAPGGGCCSVADVEDARRVSQQLGVAHHVFNFTSEFERDVVGPYVDAHAHAMTPNPCIDCNARLKFGRFLQLARLLDFEAIVTGHHARVTTSGGALQLRRGRDTTKDQSYVLYMLGQSELAHVLLPIGELTKPQVRQLAGDMGLRTAAKPDSQDACFISGAGGRESFLGERVPVHPGRLVTAAGEDVGVVDALELVTVGQRRGLGAAARSRPERRYVLSVDLERRTATLGPLADLLDREVLVGGLRWSQSPPPPGTRAQVQLSAHGVPLQARWEGARLERDAPGWEAPGGGGACGRVVLDEPARRVAAGQAVVLYRPDEAGDVVIGGGTAVVPRPSPPRAGAPVGETE
jgi:tRNA-specific 2-thiouridylase